MMAGPCCVRSVSAAAALRRGMAGSSARLVSPSGGKEESQPEPRSRSSLAAPGGAPAGPFDYLPFFYSRVFNLSWQVRAAWRAAPPYSPRGWAVSGEGERCLEGAAA
jgi:hypothetical protein